MDGRHFEDLSLEVPSRDVSYSRDGRILNEEHYRNIAKTPQFAEPLSRIDGKSEAINTPS